MTELETLQRDLATMWREHPECRAVLTDALQNMVHQLHIALYGTSWARPQSPEQVWRLLLANVSGMALENRAAGRAFPF